MRKSLMGMLAVTFALTACGDDKKNSGTGPDGQCVRGTLTLGRPLSGSVGSADCAFEVDSEPFLGGRFDAYTVSLVEGRVYQVQLDASGDGFLDGVIEVLSPGGTLVAIADDEPTYSSLESEMFFLARQTGQFTIRAGGYDGEERGAYRLTVRECGATRITSTAAIQGTLSAPDCRSSIRISGDDDSGFVDVYVLSVGSSRPTITVTTSAFSPVVYFGGPDVLSDYSFFDQATGSPAILRVSIGPPSGDFIVLVGSAAARATGAYTIQSSIVASTSAVGPGLFFLAGLSGTY